MDLRELERSSIRAFVQRAADDGYLSGRVGDLGCGKQPYRSIVEAAGGHYEGYDSPSFPGSTVTEQIGESWNARSVFDSILFTQVVQYVEEPLEDFLVPMCEDHLVRGGHLVMTYPTNWPEVEPEDLHRFTKTGMERLLTEAGFEIVRHERRAEIQAVWGDGEHSNARHDLFAIGYGVIARA